MPSPLDKLLTLQRSDSKSARLNREAQDIPARKQQIEARLEEHRAALHDAEEEIRKHALKTRELEGEIEAAKSQITKFQHQQFAVKNNDEYRALEREIAATRQKIRKLEDRELEVMQEAEDLQRVAGERRGALAEEEKSVKAETAVLGERQGNLQADLEKLKAERPSLTEGIDSVWLSRYERILSHVGDAAVVPVQSGSCGGCHMNLPPQIVHDARKNDTLTVCNYCGRMLYSP